MLNIVPSRCELEFEIRNVAAEIPEEILSRLRTRASEIANGARTIASEAAINIDVVNSYPGLNIACDAPVVHLVKSLTGDANVVKVPFGTEAGLFLQRLGFQRSFADRGRCSRVTSRMSLSKLTRLTAATRC